MSPARAVILHAMAICEVKSVRKRRNVPKRLRRFHKSHDGTRETRHQRDRRLNWLREQLAKVPA